MPYSKAPKTGMGFWVQRKAMRASYRRGNLEQSWVFAHHPRGRVEAAVASWLQAPLSTHIKTHVADIHTDTSIFRLTMVLGYYSY